MLERNLHHPELNEKILIGICGVWKAGLPGFRNVPNHAFEPFHAPDRPEAARGPMIAQTIVIVKLLLFEAMI